MGKTDIYFIYPNSGWDFYNFLENCIIIVKREVHQCRAIAYIYGFSYTQHEEIIHHK